MDRSTSSTLIFTPLPWPKYHRGNEKDFDDVVRMIQTGLIGITVVESYSGTDPS